MPRKPSSTITQAADESHDAFLIRLFERRKAFADASSETWLEQPRLFKNNKQDARKDTVLPKPSPTTRASDPSEDGEEAEF